jgi:signal peptidase
MNGSKTTIFKILDWLKTIAFVFVLAIGALALLSSSNKAISVKLPIKPYNVLSGSMKPTISEGSMVFVKRNEANFAVGDIITFIRPDNPKENVTHRIIKKDLIGKRIIYETKGDANNVQDSWKVRPEAIWGKVIFNIPYIGYFISFSTTKVGVIVTIALPLIIIIVDEIRVIYVEIQKMKKKKMVNKTITQTILFILIFISFTSIASSPIYALFTSTIKATKLQISTACWIKEKNGNNIEKDKKCSKEEDEYKNKDKDKDKNKCDTNNPRFDFDKTDFKSMRFYLSCIDKKFKKLRYTLTYDTDTITRGVEGKQDQLQENYDSNPLIFGSCSAGGKCVYDKDVHNIHVSVILDDQDDKTITLENNIP